MPRWSRTAWHLASAIAVVAVVACGAGGEQQANNQFPAKGTAGHDAGSEDDAAQDSTVGTVDSGSDVGLIDVVVSDNALQDSPCATEHVQSERVPLDLYLMADRSGSMQNGNPTRWISQSSALKAFFFDARSAGLYMALRFFPLDDSYYPQDPQCSGNAYKTPLVDWGLLPDHAPILAGAVDATRPNGNFTPTEEALRGVLAGALERKLAHPDHAVAVVLISDGVPCCGDCMESSSGLGQIAAQYANGDPPIKTFTVYVAQEASDVMTAIAQSGGTGTAFNATTGQAAFLEALESIRGSLIGCEYKMPVAEAGTIDRDRIGVHYTGANTTEPVVVDRVMTQADCTAEDGWYYDDNEAPTRIILCPSTCARVQADEQANIDIYVGCESNQPH